MNFFSGKMFRRRGPAFLFAVSLLFPGSLPATSVPKDIVAPASNGLAVADVPGNPAVALARPVHHTNTFVKPSAPSMANASLSSSKAIRATPVKPKKTSRRRHGLPFQKMLIDLLKGLLVSAEIFFLTILFSLPLGLAVAFGRMSKFLPVQWFFRIYISVMRGTPLMLQLFFFYFGPYYIFGIGLTSGYRFIACIIAFALNYAAYFAEIYRAGIEAIPIGQYEAGKVLGFTKAQTFMRIILPQVIKRILPPVTNEVITLVKDTSLAFTLSVMEMFTCAKMAASAHTTMTPFIVAGVFYYIFNFIVAWAMERIEKSLGYYR